MRRTLLLLLLLGCTSKEERFQGMEPQGRTRSADASTGKNVRPPRKGLLSVTSKPSGALVMIDEVVLGRTPVIRPAPPGEVVEVTLRGSEHPPHSLRITRNSDGNFVANVDLEAATARKQVKKVTRQTTTPTPPRNADKPDNGALHQDRASMHIQRPTAQALLERKLRAAKTTECANAYAECKRGCRSCRRISDVQADARELSQRPDHPREHGIRRSVPYSNSGNISDNDCCLRCYEAYELCEKE